MLIPYCFTPLTPLTCGMLTPAFQQEKDFVGCLVTCPHSAWNTSPALLYSRSIITLLRFITLLRSVATLLRLTATLPQSAALLFLV